MTTETSTNRRGHATRPAGRIGGEHTRNSVSHLSIAPHLAEGTRPTTPQLTVFNGGITAYDTYQIDTEQHPEWSEDHKIARAGAKGAFTGLGTWGGAALGAKGGAAIGAAVSGPFAPVGAVVGGVVGGVIGGVAGHYLGAEAGDMANDAIVKPINEG